MHDIKLIRTESSLFEKRISSRNVKIDLKSLLNLDKKNRDLIKAREKFERENGLGDKK